ncbi:MAG: hypothetical protein RL612_821 [Actinomycetota bacterium]|jgi:hypothetical protein
MNSKSNEPAVIETFTLYTAKFLGLYLELENGSKIDMSFALKNGRASYVIFEHLVSLLSGLLSNSQGGDSDLASIEGLKYEVKAYPDPETYPASKHDLFHTGASSTFGANNVGRATVNPALKAARENPDDAAKHYQVALDACIAAGYSKNDFYIYTNTAQFEIGTPFRFMVFPTSTVMENLDSRDPRLISRQTLLSLIKNHVTLNFN